jgi:hypothetical protein
MAGGVGLAGQSGFATSYVGNSPTLPRQIRPYQVIGTYSADGPVSTRRRHNAVAAQGAFATILQRQYVTPQNPGAAMAITSDQILPISQRIDRIIGRRSNGHHRRNLAQTKYPAPIPPGQRPPGFAGLVAAVHAKVAIVNGFITLCNAFTKFTGWSLCG